MRYIDVPYDGQSIHVTSHRGSGQVVDHSFKNLNDRSGHLKGTITSEDAKTGGSIRLQTPQQEIAPVQADARSNTGFKGSKPSPNASNNRITGLDDLSGDIRDRSTRAQTGLMRDTERYN